MSLRLHTPPTDQPITLAEAKLHLRVDIDEDDLLIRSLIDAATAACEHLMGRAIMPQKWQLSVGSFGEGVLVLQRPTVTEIDSFTYVDPSGATKPLAPAEYRLIIGSDYTAAVVPAYNASWPAVISQTDSINVVFSCGYADADSVPGPIKSWIKLMVGALYKNREMVTDKQVFTLGMADSLLDRYRVWVM